MQRFRLKLAAVAVIGALMAAPAAAQVPCNSPTYSEMQKRAVDALKGRQDHVKSLFDQVNQMSVERMACLDIFRNMSFGGFFKWMSLSNMVDQIVNAFWNQVCNAAASAYNQATSGLSQALSQNLSLPGQMGQIVGPVVQTGIQGSPGTLSTGGTGTSGQMSSTTYQWNGQNGGSTQTVNPFSAQRPSSSASSSSGSAGTSGSSNLYR